MSIFISLPPFPDVPLVAGVPAVARAIGIAQTVDAFLTGDGPGLSALNGIPQWGIFDQTGNPVIIGDSVIGVEFRKQWAVPDYPIENGGFQNYNKVELPFEIRIGFTIGGSDSDRSAFLLSVQQACSSLYLFTVVTPEVTYPSATALHYDYKRVDKSGASLITVNVYMDEIRQTATQTFSNTQAPSGANPVNDGVVQPGTPTDAQSSVAATGGTA